MMRVLRFPVIAVLLALLLSLNGAGLLHDEYSEAAAYERVFYQSKETVKAKPASQLPQATVGSLNYPVVNPLQAYSYEQMLKDAETLKKSYPHIIATETLGTTSGGRTLLLIKLGKGSKKIILNGSHHAREYISSTLLMKMAEEYAYAYHKNIPFKGYDVKKILDAVTIYFVPMVNPDGVTLVQYGANKLTNSQEVQKINGSKKSFKSWKANGKGVDLNYQYPYGWDKIRKLPEPSSEGFKGKAPATEIETQALMKLTMDNAFLIHTAYHTQGEIIYWYNGQEDPLYQKSLEIGKKLSKLTGYRLLSEGSQKNSFGGYKDWTVTTFKKPGFTIELCPYVGAFPYPDNLFGALWEKAGASGILLAQEAASMTGYDYEVYKDGRQVQVFNSKDDAFAFAKENRASFIRHNGKILWDEK